MAKLIPHEMTQLLSQYIALEVKHHVTGSIVRDTLERINIQKPSELDLLHFKAVKQELGERGRTFEEIFRELHAMFFLLANGYTYEQAKKKARRVLEESVKSGGQIERPEYVPFRKYHYPEHRAYFQRSAA
jgi:hypothetical protein